jgi:hypothetical protein
MMRKKRTNLEHEESTSVKSESKVSQTLIISTSHYKTVCFSLKLQLLFLFCFSFAMSNCKRCVVGMVGGQKERLLIVELRFVASFFSSLHGLEIGV